MLKPLGTTKTMFVRERIRVSGLCVSGKHGLVIASDCKAMQLHVYSLADGSLLQSIGSAGSGEGQFRFDWGGLCLSPDGDSVLVAESGNDRVQQIRIVAGASRGSFVRFVGRPALRIPQHLDCNDSVIAVSELDGVSVLSWTMGILLWRFSYYRSYTGQPNWPFSVRLLRKRRRGYRTPFVVVADCSSHRLCVFTANGSFFSVVASRAQGLDYPADVLESKHGFLVANTDGRLIKLNRDGVRVGDDWKKGGAGTGRTVMAALPDAGGVLLWNCKDACFQVFPKRALRRAWIAVTLGFF